MKTCFTTVIYKQAFPFFSDLIESINAQTSQSFDLLIINDNYSKAELESLPIPEGAKVVDLSDKHLSIAGTRIEMLRAAKEMGYDLAIMGDADDTFSHDRVEGVLKAAELDKDSVFFYNKLVKAKVEKEGFTYQDVFTCIPSQVTDITPIAQENFLGMSTTAIRLDALSEEFIDSLYEGDSNVFDWYLFSRILLDLGGGRLCESGATIYRIYDNNEVGTTRDLEKEKTVKLSHYGNLAKRYPMFQRLHDKLQSIDVTKLDLAEDHQGYWWSDIKLES